jgi:putative nucleotidyltransferase with HDIG domain
MRESLRQTATALAAALEQRDPYTAGHQQRVARLSCHIARRLGLPDDRIEGLRIAGVLHDIGKIAVPAEILSKPGRLSDVEMGLIRVHPEAGHNIVKSIHFPWPVADVVVQHHERMNGSGYPAGLKGDAISLEARVLAVADVVEAMSSHRPYRPALGRDQALAHLLAGRGTLYDPEVADACLAAFEKDSFGFEERAD